MSAVSKLSTRQSERLNELEKEIAALEHDVLQYNELNRHLQENCATLNRTLATQRQAEVCKVF